MLFVCKVNCRLLGTFPRSIFVKTLSSSLVFFVAPFVSESAEATPPLYGIIHTIFVKTQSSFLVFLWRLS